MKWRSTLRKNRNITNPLRLRMSSHQVVEEAEVVAVDTVAAVVELLVVVDVVASEATKNVTSSKGRMMMISCTVHLPK